MLADFYNTLRLNHPVAQTQVSPSFLLQDSCPGAGLAPVASGYKQSQNATQDGTAKGVISKDLTGTLMIAGLPAPSRRDMETTRRVQKDWETDPCPLRSPVGDILNLAIA